MFQTFLGCSIQVGQPLLKATGALKASKCQSNAWEKPKMANMTPTWRVLGPVGGPDPLLEKPLSLLTIAPQIVTHPGGSFLSTSGSCRGAMMPGAFWSHRELWSLASAIFHFVLIPFLVFFKQFLAIKPFFASQAHASKQMFGKKTQQFC